MSIAVQSSRSVQAVLSEDLRQWFNPAELLILTLAAVAAVDPAKGRVHNFHDNGDCFPTAMLCAVLAYAYATNRLDSEDVEMGVGHDAAMRYLAANQKPGARIFRRFRRIHRDALSLCLAQLLESAWVQRKANPASGLSEESEPFVRELLGTGTNARSRWFAAAAAQRLGQAILRDTMAADL